MKMDGTTKTNYLLVFLTVFSCSLSIFNHIRYNDLKAEQEFKSPKESSIRARRSAELAETFYPSSTPYPPQDAGTSNLIKSIGEIKTMIGEEVNSILDKRLKDGDKCRCSDNGSQRGTGGPKGPKGERGERGLPGPPGPRGPRGLGLYPPQIKEKKLNINATKGNSAIFTCQFFGNPLPNITWNSRISDKEINKSIDRELSVVTSQLHARNLKWRDRGVVKCSASNILGTEYRIGTLMVLAPPRINLSSNTVIGMVGTTITFPHCRVYSDPKYNVTWKRGFPGLPQHRTYNVDGLLRISRLKIQDQGYYKCIAKNYLGTESKYVFLQVSEFKFTKKPDPYIYQSNNSVLLTCGTYGSAGLEGKWLRSDGKPLSSVTENKYKYDKYEMLVSTKVEQSGRYRCVISNNITSIETSTMVELFSLNSSLLNDTQVNTLGKWMVERNSHDKYKLCWSGSKHGFNSSIFRSRCGGKSNTITIIRTNNDTVVGGYSDIPWISDENLQTSNIEKEKDCGDKITSPGKYKVSFKKSSSCKVNFELSEASTIEILSAYFKEEFCRSNYIKVMNTIKYYGEKYCVSDIGKGKLFNLGLGSGTIEYQRSLFYGAEYRTFTFTIMIRTVKYRYSSLSFIYALQPREILSPVEDKEKAICDFENFGICFGRMDLSYHEKSIKISRVDSYKRSIVLFGEDPFKRGKYSVKDIEVHYKV